MRLPSDNIGSIRMAGIAISILLLLLYSPPLGAQEDLYPKRLKIIAGYRSELIGGDISTIAHFPAGSFTYSPSLTTYRSGEGWSSWEIDLRTTFNFCPGCGFKPSPTHWRMVGNIGVTADYLDLAARNPSGSFTTGGLLSRYRPNIEFGFGVDSMGIFCRECEYTITAEVTLADFLPITYSFIEEDTEGETLSTAINIRARLDTPVGKLGIFRTANRRDFYGEDIWRLYYSSPLMCGEILGLTVGWESEYLGFGRVDLNLKPVLNNELFAFRFGVRIPEEAAFWQWEVGLVYERVDKTPPKRGYRSGGFYREN